MHVAYDGKTAVTSAIHLRPRVLIVDIGLPDINGYDVVKQLRRIDDLAGMMVVAVTGYQGKEFVERSEENGIDFHLVKPADPCELEMILSLGEQKDEMRKR